MNSKILFGFNLFTANKVEKKASLYSPVGFGRREWSRFHRQCKYSIKELNSEHIIYETNLNYRVGFGREQGGKVKSLKGVLKIFKHSC